MSREPKRLFNKISPYLPLLYIWVLVIGFFYPFWGQGKNAIPADTLTGLYHPFRDLVVQDYPNGTPYKNYLITDAVRQQYVYRNFSIEQLKSGNIPWWNPYNFSGTPHLAGMQAASFYPLNAIFWLVDFTLGWNLLVMSQMLLGSLFMFIYLRHLGQKSIAAGVGSLVWITSGFFVAWLLWNTAVHVALWTPLILLAIDKLLGKPTNLKSYSKTNRAIFSAKIVWSGILVFSLTAAFYAGYPQPWLYLSLLQASYAGCRILFADKTLVNIIKKGLPIFVAYLIFSGLALPQLLATLELSSLSNRTADQGDLLAKPDWFIPVPQLIQTIAPDFFGNPATLNYWGVFNYTEFVSYIGVIAAILICSVILVPRRRKLHGFFFGWIIIGLLLALRNPVSILQFEYDLPFVGGSQPSRWIVIINFSMAVLAGFGLDLFLRQKTNLIKASLIPGSLILGLWIWIFNPVDLTNFTITQHLAVAKRNLILPTVEFLGTIGVVISLVVIQKLGLVIKLSKLRLLASVVFLVVIGFSGFRFAYKFITFSNPDWLYPQTSTTQFLQTNLGHYRYMALDTMILPPNVNMAYKFASIEGYDPLYLEKYGRLITSADAMLELPVDNSRGFNRFVYTNKPDSPIIDLLGVKYLLSFESLPESDFKLVHQEGKTLVYENLQVFPRAFLVDSLAQFPPTTYQAVDLEVYTPLEIKVNVTTSEPKYLIITDNWYPHWRAYMNDQPVEIIDYYGLRATIIPEGEHEIIYQYRHSYF